MLREAAAHRALPDTRAGGAHRRGLALIVSALIPGVLCAVPCAGAPTDGLPFTSMSGSTGLVRIPTAEVVPHGYYTVGIDRVGYPHRSYRRNLVGTVSSFATLGVLPHVEVTTGLTNIQDRPWFQYRPYFSGGRGGWNQDRMLSIQGVPLRQGHGVPFSLAIGQQDVTGTGVFNCGYVVATRRSPRLGLHLGYGGGRLGGLFGGADFEALRDVHLLLDHDGERANAGIALRAHNVTLTPVLTGLDTLGGSLTYTQRFGSAPDSLCPPPAVELSETELTPGVEGLRDALEAEGFENLSVEEDAERRVLRVRFENRRYRWEVAGLGVALSMAARAYDGRLELIPLHTGLPMVEVEVQSTDYLAFLRGELGEGEVFARMRITPCRQRPVAPVRNASVGKVDLAFSPGVRVNLVSPAPPGDLHGAEMRVNATASAHLWRGLALEATYVTPLSDSKPGFSRAAVTWNARLGRRGFLQLQGGRLSHGLDGIACQLNATSDSGQHLIGLSAARAAYPGWERETSHQLHYSWRPETLDVVATVSGGRFLRGDDGCSGSLFAGFGEHSVEFLYTTTSLSQTTGVVLTMPLGRMRRPRPAPVRAHFRNAFRLAYTDEQPQLSGGLSVPFIDSYQTAIRRWNRAYLRTYARQLRDAGLRWAPGGGG